MATGPLDDHTAQAATSGFSALLSGIGGYLASLGAHMGWKAMRRKKPEDHGKSYEDGRDEQRLAEVERKTAAILEKHDALVSGQEQLRLEMVKMTANMEIIKDGFSQILGALSATSRLKGARK